MLLQSLRKNLAITFCDSYNLRMNNEIIRKKDVIEMGDAVSPHGVFRKCLTASTRGGMI